LKVVSSLWGFLELAKSKLVVMSYLKNLNLKVGAKKVIAPISIS
jgi:hypothetical protein